MHLKLLQKRAIQKTSQANGDLVGNKITNKIKKVSRISPQNNSEKDIYLQKKAGNY